MGAWQQPSQPPPRLPLQARRKEQLEAQLAQAEADIKSLQHGGTVYVVMDS